MFNIENNTGILTLAGTVDPGNGKQLFPIATITINKQIYVYTSSGLNAPYTLFMYRTDSVSGPVSGLVPLSTPSINVKQNTYSITAINIDTNNYLYVTSGAGSNSIDVYQIDNNTGIITTPFTSTNITSDLPFNHTIKIGTNIYFYVVQASNVGNLIYTFSINSSGVLIPRTNAVAAGIMIRSITTVTNGTKSYAYVKCSNSQTGASLISMFNIDNNTGVLTATSPSSISTGASLGSIASVTIGANSYVYLGSVNGTLIYMYGVYTNSGLLYPLSPATVTGNGSGASIYTMKIDGKYYLYMNVLGTLRMYSISDSGQLTPLSTPTIGGGGGYGMAIAMV